MNTQNCCRVCLGDAYCCVGFNLQEYHDGVTISDMIKSICPEINVSFSFYNEVLFIEKKKS